MRTCIIASIIATSVPGSGWTNWSASSAVIVRIGSMTTTSRAVGAGRFDHRPEVAVGEPRVRAPQEDQLASARARAGRAPRPVPFVIVTPAPTVGPQMLRSSWVAPRWLKKRSRDAHRREQALVAGVAERQDRLAAVLVDDGVEARSAISASAVVPRDRLELPAALGAGAAQRVQDAVGAVDAVEEAVDLRAQLAVAVGVVGVAAQLDGDAVVDGDRPAARVGAVVVARPVHGASWPSDRYVRRTV